MSAFTDTHHNYSDINSVLDLRVSNIASLTAKCCLFETVKLDTRFEMSTLDSNFHKFLKIKQKFRSGETKKKELKRNRQEIHEVSSDKGWRPEGWRTVGSVNRRWKVLKLFINELKVVKLIEGSKFVSEIFPKNFSAPRSFRKTKFKFFFNSRREFFTHKQFSTSSLTRIEFFLSRFVWSVAFSTSHSMFKSRFHLNHFLFLFLAATKRWRKI